VSLKEDLMKLVSDLEETQDYFAIVSFADKNELDEIFSKRFGLTKPELVEPDDVITFPYYVVQQSGYLGDDYSGTMWIELDPDFFAVVEYRC